MKCCTAARSSNHVKVTNSTSWPESAEDGRFNFHVEISHPLTGLIVRYRGWLVPKAV